MTPTHRSVSQESTFTDCGVKYLLTRKSGAKEVPAWWNAGGSAFHSAIEWVERERVGGTMVDKDAATQVFIRCYANEMTKLSKIEPDVELWRGAKKGAEGQFWWLKNGVEMVHAYMDANGPDRGYEVLVLPDGTPALELEFLLDVEGVMVKGFIDQVMVFTNGDVLVRDLKTGSRVPSDTFQLGTYGHAMERCFDTPTRWGDYWMARKAVSASTTDLQAVHPWAQVAYRYTAMDRAEKAGIYMPRVSSFCASCGVRDLCPMQNPQQSVDKLKDL